MAPTAAHMRVHFHESNLIEGFHSDLADDLYAAAWETMRDLARPVTHADIRNAQQMITSHQVDLPENARGRYRGDTNTYRVVVGGRLGTEPVFVQSEMERWLRDYEDSTDTRQSHIDFETIHPFLDGNGRTGRLLMWLHEARLGRAPTVVTYANRFAYYDWFLR